MTQKNYNKKVTSQQDLMTETHQWLEAAGVPQEGSLEQWILVKNLILEELQELEDAIEVNDRREQMDAITDLFIVISNWDYMNNLHSYNYFNKVIASNKSKFCATREEATATVLAYQMGMHRSKPGEKIDCYSEQHGDLWIVKRADGKVMKSINYKTPNEQV